MGQQTALGTTDRQTAIRWMLRDLQALQVMLRDDRFETGIRRIGAEQEMFLVDASWQPAPGALPMLAALTDHPYTTEVGAFNLELNLDPQEFSGDCFTRMHAPARRAARPRARRRRDGRAPRRPRRHVADDPQARPDDGQHGPEPALPRPQQRPHGPARRGLRAAHQGHRRAARAPGLGDGRGVQRQLPGPPPGHAGRVRQRLQRRPGAQRPDAGERHQLAAAVRQAAVGGDPDRPVRAVGRHPPTRPPRPRAAGSSELRRRLGDVVGRRAVQGGHHPVPAGPRPGRLRRSVAGSWPRGAIPELPALRLHTGTVWRWNRACYGISHTARRRRARTCASRIGSCRRGRARSTRSPTPRCGSG